MPPVKFDRIISVSTEDPKYPASNLLNPEVGSGCWKTKECGEKQAVVIFQLEQPSVINSVDIGNENSAFIEILVSRSAQPDNFQVLVIASSLMTVKDARNGLNKSSIRFFKHEQLTKPTAIEPWDRVKIICSQPFNSHVQYGLSFIQMYSKNTNNGQLPINKNQYLGRFALKSDSENGISVGSSFAKRKENSEPITAAAAIREASKNLPVNSLGGRLSGVSSGDHTKHVSKKKKIDDDLGEVQSSRKATKGRLLYTEDEEENGALLSHPSSGVRAGLDVQAFTTELFEKTNSGNESQNHSPKHETPKVRRAASQMRQNKNVFNVPENQSSASDTLPSVGKKQEGTKRKAFNKLLEGITFSISGYQNPYRSEIRSKAVELGAKYKSDWDNQCTHLICAFANTPKYKQVCGSGHIVRKDWIEDCYSQRKRLPWKRYALKQSDVRDSESDEEIWEENVSPVAKKISIESVSDTEDEAKRANKRQQSSYEIDVYEIDTDIDDDEVIIISEDTKISDLENETPYLPSYFDHLTFYIDPAFPEDIKKCLQRYIIAVKGKIIKDLKEDVDYIVSETSECWKPVLNNEMQVVHPSWIWDCYDAGNITAIQQYVIL